MAIFGFSMHQIFNKDLVKTEHNLLIILKTLLHKRLMLKKSNLYRKLNNMNKNKMCKLS